MESKEVKEATEEKSEKILQRVARTQIVSDLSQKTGISRTTVAVISIIVLLLLFLTIFGVDYLCEIAAFVYPGYKTYKVLQRESRVRGGTLTDLGIADREKKSSPSLPSVEEEDEPELTPPKPDAVRQEQVVWLTYWVVYGAFTILEVIIYFFFSWVPSYSAVRCVYLVWCFVELNGKRGCMVVYDHVVGPFLIHHSPHIEKGINTSLKGVNQAGSEIVGVGSTVLGNALSNVVSVEKLTSWSLQLLSVVNASGAHNRAAAAAAAAPPPHHEKKKLE